MRLDRSGSSVFGLGLDGPGTAATRIVTRTSVGVAVDVVGISDPAFAGMIGGPHDELN